MFRASHNELNKINYTATRQSKEICESLIQRTYVNLKSMLGNMPSQRAELCVVSLGCGFGLEVAALKKFFQERNQNFTYIGIDNDLPTIQVAQNMFANFTGVKFYHGDASNSNFLEQLLTKEKCVDIAIFQHPYLLDHDPATKQKFIDIITKVLPKHLKEHAIIYASVYYLKEKEVLERLKVNGLPAFDPRICSSIQHLAEDGTIQNISGQQVIPEQFVIVTCLSNPKLLQLANVNSSCSRSCFFTVAAFGAIAAATVTYWMYTINEETPTLHL